MARVRSATAGVARTADLVRFASMAWDRLHAHGVRSLAVLSTQPGEGVTTVTCALGQLFAAQRGIRVLLVDANGRHPALADAAGVDAARGWRDTPAAPPADVCVATEWPLVSVCPYGTVEAGAAPLTEARMQTLVEGCEETGAFVLLDCAPLASMGEALQTVRHADAAVLIVEADRLSHEVLRHSCTTLDSLGVHFLGAILNRHRRSIPGFLYRRM